MMSDVERHGNLTSSANDTKESFLPILTEKKIASSYFVPNRVQQDNMKDPRSQLETFEMLNLLHEV